MVHSVHLKYNEFSPRRKRIDLLEETNGKRESRLREENELLSSQHMASLKLVEQEKAELIMAHVKRQEAWQAEKQTESERLREIHRFRSAHKLSQHHISCHAEMPTDRQ